MSSGGAERKVVFGLEFRDSAVNQQLIDQMKQRVKEAEQEIVEEIERGNKTRQELEALSVTARITAMEELKQAEIGSLQQRLDLAHAHGQAMGNVEAAIQKRREKALQDWQDEMLQAGAVAVAEIESAGQEFQAARAQIIQGVSQIQRGISFLGLGASDTASEMAEVIAQAQGVYDVVVGAQTAYDGLTRAVGAYKRMAEATLAIEKAIAVTRGASLSSGARFAFRAFRAPLAAGRGIARAGAAVLGAGGGIPAAFAAAAAGVVLGGKAIQEALTGQAKGVDSITGKIAEWEVGLVAKVSRFFGGSGFGGREVAEMEKRRESMLGQQARTNALGEVVAAAISKVESARMDIRSRQIGLDFTGREAVKIEFMELRQEMSRLGAENIMAEGQDASPAAREARENAILAIRQRMTALVERDLQLVKQQGQEQQRNAAREMEALRRQIQMKEDAYKRERDRLLSAKERFGELSLEEQSDLIALKRRAQQGQHLDRDEMQKLKSIGTDEVTDFARRRALEAADRAGFDREFGHRQRRRIAELQREGREMVIELRGKQEHVLELKQDNEKLVQQITGELKGMLELSNRQLMARVKKEMDDGFAQVNRMNDDQLKGRAQTFSRGKRG